MKNNMKTVVALLFVFLLGSCQQQNSEKAMNTEEDKTFYAVGLMLGGRFKDLALNDDEFQFLVQGLRDAVKGNKEKVELGAYQMKIQEMFSERVKKMAEQEQKKGEDFVDSYLKNNSSAKKTASGLVYELMEDGKGKAPKEDDVVEVHYHGTLISGEVFDSSRERGQTVKFPLNRVIKGWTEGLQLAKEGTKMKLVIPSHLAYGIHGAPPKIPGGATLIFEVELIKVNPEPEKKAETKAPQATEAKKTATKKG